MCGILGTIPKTEKNFFKKALDTLKHRGPDDYGVETIKDTITLGHRRLSIIDLSSQAHQPMSDHTKRYNIVFNGEIYNFLEIKKTLIQKGYIFHSNSDTEVLLNAYIEWGKECVLKFNGMWAFAIWDSLKEELFLSRDRFGKKPLFYTIVNHLGDQKFIFASEMKAIYPFLKKLKPSKDFHWMKKNIFLYESSEKCLIENIKRFPHGHNGFFKNGELKIYRYWNTLDHLEETPKNYSNQVERFRELFFDACKIRMRSDVTMGTALSGGLDSSSTISAMSYLSKGHIDYGKEDWQHAFVASFPGTPLDETKYAKMVVDNIGIKANYININPLDEWSKLEDYFYKFEELYITSPIPMLMTYGAVRSNGVRVTLDGHGADELLSGYGHIIDALWDSKYNIKNTFDILDIYQTSIGSFEQVKRKSSLELYITYMLKAIIKKIIGRKLMSKDSHHVNFKKLDNFSKHLYLIFHETILPTLLRNYDRYSMANSVEIRMPFMDHRIVTYINSLPYSSKFSNGYTKRIIRDALDPYMPKEVTWRKEKIGFNSPIVDWMQKDLKDWFLDTVHEQNFIECSLIDNPKQLQERVLNIVNKKNSDFSEAERVWTELSTYIWEKSIKNRI